MKVCFQIAECHLSACKITKTIGKSFVLLYIYLQNNPLYPKIFIKIVVFGTIFPYIGQLL